jgi:F-type H+-transporting ATPase subunit O
MQAMQAMQAIPRATAHMGARAAARGFAAQGHSVEELKMQTTAAIWKLRKMKGLSPAPIRLFDTSGKYAHAIYGAANTEGVTTAVEKDIMGLATLLQSNPTFASFLASPVVSKKSKMDACAELYKQNNYNPVSQRFINLVIENGRGKKLIGIAESFNKLLKAERQEIDVKIVTASEPTAASLAETKNILGHVLKQRYGSAAKMILSTEVNPELKGGMTVDIGEYHMDLSVATKERKFKEYMLADLAKVPSLYPATVPPKPAGLSDDQIAKEILAAGARGDLYALHTKLAK